MNRFVHFGFVDAETPEVGMGVALSWRGQGIGYRLLSSLVAQTRSDGLAPLSLSVERDNYARGLYERVGFRAVESAGGSLTMLLRLYRSPNVTRVKMTSCSSPAAICVWGCHYGTRRRIFVPGRCSFRACP